MSERMYVSLSEGAKHLMAGTHCLYLSAGEREEASLRPKEGHAECCEYALGVHNARYLIDYTWVTEVAKPDPATTVYEWVGWTAGRPGDPDVKSTNPSRGEGRTR